MKDVAYVAYQATRFPMPFTFLYPQGWTAREIAEDGSLEVFVAGPRSGAGTYTISLSVRVTPAGQETAETAAAALVAKYRGAPGFMEHGRASGMVAGQPAVELDISYVLPLPLNSARPQRTTVRERHILFKRGNRLFELLYAAPQEDYDAWLGAFRTLAQTLYFETASPQGTFRPLVPAPPAQQLREGAGDYDTGSETGDGQPE